MNISDTLKGMGFKDLGYLMGPGIYVLCLKGVVVYVGQTINIFDRLSDKDHKYRSFDRIYFIRCDSVELNRLEALMILKLKPEDGAAFNFNKNVDPRNSTPTESSGSIKHILTLRGVELELKPKRRRI